MKAVKCAPALALCALVLIQTPAAALSTAQEISYGKELNQKVDDQSLIVKDHFLGAWVSRIAERLTPHRYRKDIDYHFEIVNSNEINSFALPGGFIHVDMGLLNFASSDDELASVMGHEMGHVERRHVITLAQKANWLSILVGVLAVLSPIGYALGGYGGDLAFYKFSRQDELQADQYGLLLMTQGGYDPQSMVDLMYRLGRMQGGADSRADKYFQDHPDPKDRVSHLLGYPALDKTNGAQLTAQAIHDAQEGRYSYAQTKFSEALKSGASNPLAAERLAEVEVALRESGARAGSEARAQTASAFVFDASDAERIAAQVAQASALAAADSATAKENAKSARQDIQTFLSQLQTTAGALPKLPGARAKGNNLSLALEGLNHLTRDVNGTLDLTSDVASTAPGLVSEDEAALKELGDALRYSPLTPKTAALLQHYPGMTVALAAAADGITASLDHARAAISLGSDAVHLLADYFNVLTAVDTAGGDISANDMPRVKAALERAQSAWDKTQAMALRASNEMYGGQTRELSARITLLDLASSRQRYDAYRRAISYRFAGITAPDYTTVLRLGIPAGEIGCAAWTAYEIKRDINEVIAQSRANGQACVERALQSNLLLESLEIAEGLLYEDYLDKPQKT